MRAGRAALAAAALLAACSPEIGNGTYYCGPERLCPPDQECDDNRYTCDSPRRAQRFECPPGTEDSEPDDTSEQAVEAGALTCGAVLVGERHGCVADAGDADLIAFEVTGTCVGDDPHLEVALRFPIALVPLQVELLDEAGAVIAEGVLCTTGDVTGTDRVCIETPLEVGRYLLRVRSAPGAPDCDGDCHHNQYTLDVAFPLA